MLSPALASRSALRALLAVGSLMLTGCEHAGFGSLEGHYTTFSVPEPKGATVHVCHAYGCRMRTKFTFTERDLADLAALMKKTRGTEPDTLEQERRAVAYAIGWMETRVGNVIGTKDDRAGMDFAGSGDPTQQDCVDEATNTTSYLSVLHANGLIRHHTVGIPFSKENYLRGIAGWTHWTAVLIEKPWSGDAKRKIPATPGGQKWAVDSWIYANGENPAIVKTEDWYIKSLAELPGQKR